MSSRHQRRLRWLKALSPPLFFSLLVLYAAWPWLPFSTAREQPRTVILYGFSILGPAMNEAIFPAFQEKWHAETGEQVEFVSAFAGSGTITNQIIMGVPADVAVLALELDAWRLAEAGVVETGSWRRLPHAGVVNRSPFVILVRPGNPLKISGFADLGRPGVQVIHPDPLTSGAANWSIVAEYGAGMRAAGGDHAAGVALLSSVWANVSAQAASARAARTQFENGFGDALVTYEQDVLLDVLNGSLAGEIVYPQSTIFSEHTVVVIKRNVDEDEAALVAAFIDFLWSPEAQEAFADYGFRSVDPAINSTNPQFVPIADPFFIADFGGWQEAKADIVDAIWRDRVLKELD